MSKAIIMQTTGGPEVLRWQDHDPGRPQAGEVLIEQKAVGLNYIDVYHRTGLYPLPALPAVPGMEGAGTVLESGPGVDGFSPGDRVAYAGLPVGAYAQRRCLPAHRLVAIPEAIGFEEAAAMMLQGMTARYLLKGCYEVRKGTTVLLQAAAGGVGLIMCQWARHLGATVIGTVGSEEKAALAREHGCAHTILYNKEDIVGAVKDITDGRGVDVAYDSVGQATFDDSLSCLRPRGMMVSFGQSSGPVAPLDLGRLAAQGSVFLTRPSLMHYTAERSDLLTHAEDLFELVLARVVSVRISNRFRLEDAAAAHRLLEARKTTGSSIFLC